ncbi:uncharacterized protein LOC129939928 [Eupeodes corollae]|uniref:uncharacterized protein LOC129939928 n=1 Tax=Eupeodes corollae TaxID=290404 RepID=UPI002491EFD4|nr:uncharacterized protein LOC129939928 [Eupeodes corollae]
MTINLYFSYINQAYFKIPGSFIKMEREVIATLIVCFIVVHVQSLEIKFPEADESLRNYITSTGCLEKADITMELAFDYSRDYENIKSFLQLFEDNPNLKCYGLCLYEFGTLMDGCSATIDEDFKESVRNNPAHFAMLEEMEECATKLIGNDPCECAYQMDKCIYKWIQNEKEKEKAKGK